MNALSLIRRIVLAWFFLATTGATGAVAESASSQPAVRLGVDCLSESGFAVLRNKRVGLVTNPSGADSQLRSTIDVLREATGVTLVALFGPEHGVRGETPAGEHVGDARDALSGLPEYSLYGKTRKPTPEMLAGIDTLVFDMQDIGARSYTYISTLAMVMETAAESGLSMVVLDRPNPLGGQRMEGCIAEPAFKSFVGFLPIPYLHGLTIGELAGMINGEGWLEGGKKCDLVVVPMSGWRRSMTWDDTGLHWVPTSPHIPHARTPMFYAATGIMGELHVLSEGVGTPQPFELAGHPELNAFELADALRARAMPGVVFRPTSYRPFYGRLKEQTCGGVQIHLLNAGQSSLTELQWHVLDAVRALKPDLKLFGGKRDQMFDKVCGTDRIRKLWQAGAPLEAIVTAWRDMGDFAQRRRPYLLYD